MDRRINGFHALWLLIFSATLMALPVEAKRKTGEIVQLSGQILDRENQPVEGLIVVLEAARAKYSLLKRQRIVEPPVRQTAQVDAQGRFLLEWQWDRHFNQFDLSVGVEVTRGGAPDFEILIRTDVTQNMLSKAPVNINLTLERAGYVRWLQRYLADRATEDEEKIYQELGRPDRIKEGDDESSWWYFSLGKTYRFVRGELDQVTHFDPMKSP